MNIAALAKLFVLFINRTKSSDAYYSFQAFQAQNILEKIILRLDLKTTDTVCDFGCGKGGYANVLAQYFSNVDAVDFCADSRNPSTDEISFYECNLLNFASETPYDFIFCASVIEHIATQQRQEFVQNIAANLRVGGMLYLNFPPFLSLIGGHRVAPFHYFPDAIALRLANMCKKEAMHSYETMNGTWGLYKTYIDEIKQLLEDNHFTILEISSRFMPQWYVWLFRHNNFFNWNVEFFAQKEL
jgi:SAM-dependent methyltransferase